MVRRASCGDIEAERAKIRNLEPSPPDFEMTRSLRCNICDASVDPEHDGVWTKDGLEIVRCPACGILFRAALPAPEELPELYDSTYFQAEDRSEGGQGYADYVGEAELHRLNA